MRKERDFSLHYLQLSGVVFRRHLSNVWYGNEKISCFPLLVIDGSSAKVLSE